MVSNISLNQFAPNTPVAGLYVYMANLPQLHNVIVSTAQTTELVAGAVLTLDSASTNTNAPIAKQATAGDTILGVLVYNPIQTLYKAGDRVAVARENDIIWMSASAAIAAGASVTFDGNNQVAAGTTNTIGTALTPATAKGDFVQVELKFAAPTASTPGGTD